MNEETGKELLKVLKGIEKALKAIDTTLNKPIEELHDDYGKVYGHYITVRGKMDTYEQNS